ncbi:MAG TPA: hypothetical protein PKD24_15740 [Pyrinomonadaceae bacterium]|nr:hypothetical protein [Pyrinomonadaceae bacterium]HMP66858.1 hypothetical protein [Pyrinomonadaceae bacterium]
MPDKPFPKSEAEIEQLIDRLEAELPAYQVLLGLTVGDMVRLSNAKANFHYIRDVAGEISGKKESFQDFKNAMFNGPETPTIDPPVFPVIALPELHEQGIIPFIRSLIKQLKASPNYTEAIGEVLDLVVDSPDHLNPGDIVPELRLKSIEDGEVEIKFSKQGLDAIRIDWRVKDTTEWQNAGTFTTSPAIHSHPSTDGKPEAREYRGRLLKKNVPVSQYSAIYTVVTNP